jgi:peptidoglycan/LPS O-acetylase OafA/YrhL
MRYASIDLLRTLAIVLMVIVHFLENLAGVDWAPAGFGAPLFGFLVGVSYRIWLAGAERRGLNDETISKVTIRRGVFLFLAGLAFNVFVWLPEDTYNWDVLTLLATGFVVLNGVRVTPPTVSVVFCVLVFLASPLLRLQVDYNSYWAQDYFDPDLTLGDTLVGFLVTGYFPVFPWIIFPVLGYVTALYLQIPCTVEESAPTAQQLWPVAALGVIFISISYGFRWLHQSTSHPMLRSLFTGWTMFPASPEYLAGILGGVLLGFAVCLWLVDGCGLLRRVPWFLWFVQLLSKYSLSIYVLHHVVHLWPLWLYGVWKGQEPTHYWQQAMPWEYALALVPVYFLASTFFFWWMDATKRSSLETALRWFSE